jgi:hypothetical protein
MLPMNAADQAEQYLRRLNQAAFDKSGVDLTQIDMMLALTPEQRLAVLYETAISLARLMVHANADPIL